MANRLYPLGAQKMLSGQINFDADPIKAVLVSDGYTFSAAHEFLSDVGALVGSPQTLTGKTTTGGVFDAEDLAFGAIPPGSTAKALVLFLDTGNPSTSPVIVHDDEITGFPFATNGGDVNIPWSNGPYKILSLV